MDPDHLDELRERLRQTQQAAARIAGRVPPQGWASPRETEHTAAEIQAVVAVLHTLRDVVPDDLWDQVREIVRQLLLLVRAILDFVVERLAADRPSAEQRAGGPDLQDIPIA
ncbi:MAG TPA: hypothetical protein VK501_22945 [Baekduia sp.]|uniref:hypothetical protein n=1 Tax=Baekduia sp. TaxID=2600305 RepID=UPI002BB2E610|nr:hypothetical protein [Baekduia sp.]HMJ36780.1 hypothetical protein [Baekduia sp.]